MTGAQIVFLVCAGLILGSAVMVVTARNLMHAAFWLIAALFGVAVLYALLEAGFMAVIQVVIYIGAIAIMFIFADMLTRREVRESRAQIGRNWPLAAFAGLSILTGLVALILGQPGVSRTASAIPAGVDPVAALGTALVSPDAYVLPFEVASVLLLAALVGAVYIAGIVKK
ncbi:MAG: NADH-quinone oxidoreductase subunit J [Anaerolineales bacterium]